MPNNDPEQVAAVAFALILAASSLFVVGVYFTACYVLGLLVLKHVFKDPTVTLDNAIVFWFHAMVAVFLGEVCMFFIGFIL